MTLETPLIHHHDTARPGGGRGWAFDIRACAKLPLFSLLRGCVAEFGAAVFARTQTSYLYMAGVTL